MKRLTDEEYDALDEYYTKNMPKIDVRKNGGFAKTSSNLITVDEFSMKWLMLKAIETEKSAAVIISEMIQKEIAAEASPQERDKGTKGQGEKGCEWLDQALVASSEAC